MITNKKRTLEHIIQSPFFMGIAAILLGVDAAELEYVGIHHTATEDLHPAGVLTEAAALATADEA